MSDQPLVQMIDIEKHFGGVRAVDHVSVSLYPGEVVGLLGHNGAGKSCLMRILSGAMTPSSGEIRVNGTAVRFAEPNDARAKGIETIYQTLALADHLDAPSNLFLGRELKTRFGNLDDAAMLRGRARGAGPAEPQLPQPARPRVQPVGRPAPGDRDRACDLFRQPAC